MIDLNYIYFKLKFESNIKYKNVWSTRNKKIPIYYSIICVIPFGYRGSDIWGKKGKETTYKCK